MFPAVTFRIPTTWHVLGRIEDVAEILSEPEAFPRWWGEVYLSVTHHQQRRCSEHRPDRSRSFKRLAAVSPELAGEAYRKPQADELDG